jgi:ribonuclease PH
MARKRNQLRKIEIIRDFTKYAAGSVLIKWGDTWVLCTASVSDKVPSFLRDTGKGWVTAEYSMLPGSTLERKEREIKKLKPDARGSEISRLIGRSLRAAVDLEKLGERQITIDCDVLQADGGTRCASITGGYCALALALCRLRQQGLLDCDPLRSQVAAVSVGIVHGEPLCDLCYVEDSGGEVDFNFVMNEKGDIIELQGTGEERPFSKTELDDMYALARQAAAQLIGLQKQALEE